MRFHHSTRRGRNRLHHQHHNVGHSSAIRSRGATSLSRWSQLGYCRETNIHFNTRLPVDPPPRPPEPVDCQDTGTAKKKQTCEDLLSSFESTMTAVNNRRSIGVDEVIDTKKPDKRRASDDEAQTDIEHDLNLLHKLSLEEQSSSSKGTPESKINMLSKGKSPAAKDNRPAHDNQASFVSTKPAHPRAAIPAKHKIDLETARSKLIAQVGKHPFWSSKAARRMDLTGVSTRQIYIYELVSYCERRELEWRYEPYRGRLTGPSSPYKRPVVVSATDPGNSPDTDGRKGAETPASGLDFTTSRPPSSLVPVPSMHRSTVNVPPSGGGDTAKSGSSSAAHSSPSARRINSGPINRLTASTWRSSLDGQSADMASVVSGTTPPSSPIRRVHSSSSASATTTIRMPSTGAHRSSCSTDTTPTRVAHPSQYRPGSSLERRKEPSAEFIWSIEVPPLVRPEPFSCSLHSREVPNTSFIKRCHGCQGRGRIKCNSCYGVGYEVCLSCSGRGTTKSLSPKNSTVSRYSSSVNSHASSRNSSHANGYDLEAGPNHSGSKPFSGSRNEPGGITNSSTDASAWVADTCHMCHGAGQKRCWVCAGRSYNVCAACAGCGQLRCFLNVNISWTNHRDEHLLNNADNIVPRDRLKLSSGMAIVDQVSNCLQPIAYQRIEGATSSVIDARQLEWASKRLLDRHASNYCRHERLIKQRQRVTQVEAHIVSYEWKRRRGHFVIYGEECKVYIAKYPFKSICNIT